MRKRTVWRLGLGGHILLAALLAAPYGLSTARAEIVCEEENAGEFCVRTCTDTVTSEQTASSVPWACGSFDPSSKPTDPLPSGPLTSGSSGGSGGGGTGEEHCSRSGNLTSCVEKCVDGAGYVTKYIILEGPCTTGNEVPNTEDVDCTDDQIAPDRCLRKCYDKTTGELKATIPYTGTCGSNDPGNSGSSSGGGGSNPDEPICGQDGTGVTCCTGCQTQIPEHHNRIRKNISDNFDTHEQWMITTWFQQNILSEMMMMASQLTTAGMYQIEIFGTFLDAKHQLETQRLFQQMTARAQKDYQPSEGMCTFGTAVRSLAQSDRKVDAAHTTIATRMMQRQALTGDVTGKEGKSSDKRSRLMDFINTYCDAADNQKQLVNLCQSPPADTSRRNIDLDYTRNIESRMTLDLEFANIEGQDEEAKETLTPDEKDVFALAANLYAHNVAPAIEPDKLGDANDFGVRISAAERYLDLRSIFAKRSVAQNSFAALVGMRAPGDPSAAPYMKAVMKGLGVAKDEEIDKLLGKNPSYFAQMEVLTKKLYQKPIFYTELYDKPANVKRKGAALQAIGLMQDRDLFNSFLRSEAVLSMILETQLIEEHEKASNASKGLDAEGAGR